MSLNMGYVALYLLGSAVFALVTLTRWGWSYPVTSPAFSSLVSRLLLRIVGSAATEEDIKSVAGLVDCHETAASLAELIHKDGAGTWPPRANYVQSTWPSALRPYMDIYHEMAPLLPAETPSMD